MDSHQSQNEFIASIGTNRYPKFYRVLGCEVDCSPSKIKEQYRILSLKHHPDRGGSKKKMSMINEAYDVLSNPVKRHIYNTLGSDIFIERVEKYYHYHNTFLDFLPIFSTSKIISFLNLKEIIIYYSGNKGGRILEDGRRLGFLHVLGFPLVHRVIESSISNVFIRLGLVAEDYDTKEKGISKIKKYINVNNIIPEMIASFFSAPFEMAACKAYIQRYQIQHLLDFFIFPAKNSNNAAYFINNFKIRPQNGPSLPYAQQSSLNEIFLNIAEYVKIYKLSYKTILAFVGSRICFIILMDFLSYYSDFYHHHALEAQETYSQYLPYKNTIVDQRRKAREQKAYGPIHPNYIDNNDYINNIYNNNYNNININNSNNDDDIICQIKYEKFLSGLKKKRDTLKSISWIFYIASYCLPGLLFNSHRILLGGGGKIFSLNSLMASVANGVTLFMFDKICQQFGIITQKVNLLIKDLLDVMDKSK
ncbi:hypothetical protein ACTFIZ_000302 [Dictyostelium cf. discoideum]